MRQNCWEFKTCGREPGGARVHEMGVCPASTATKAHGIHGGQNGGRCCWALVGTLCGGIEQNSLVAKLHQCVGCDFRTMVETEEGPARLQPAEIDARMHH